MPTDTDAPENATEATEEAPVETTEATTEAAETETPVEGEEALGDPGKKALDAMKAKVKEANAAARAAAEERDRLKAAAEGREAEWEAERKAETERDQKFRNKYLKAEIKAAAKGVLSDPEDAFKFLDLDEFEVGDDGDVDSEAITAALTSLTEKKPYLAVQDGRRFTGKADAGARNESGSRQLTRDDLNGMSAEQIVEAQDKGQLRDLLAGKH